jgi:hypothetical protein
MFSRRSLKPPVVILILLALLALVVLLVPLVRSPPHIPSMFEAEFLLYVSVVVQAALGFMGVYVAMHEDWAKEHRRLVIAAFSIVMLTGFFVTVRQIHLAAQEKAQAEKESAESRKQAAVAEQRLSDTLERVGTQTGQISNQTEEIGRVQGLNTELQRKLMESSSKLQQSSDRITDLSKQAIDTVTGGDSFCYMIFNSNPPRKDAWTPFFVQIGKYPIYRVQARILDMQAFEKVIANTMTLDRVEVWVQLGDMAGGGNRYAGMGRVPPNPPTYAFDSDTRDRRDFRIWYAAFNGVWNQELQMRRVGGTWVQAVRVTRARNGKEQEIFRDVPKNFPGNGDWHP